MGKSGPLECAQLANQIQGFRNPDRSDAWENNKAVLIVQHSHENTVDSDESYHSESEFYYPNEEDKENDAEETQPSFTTIQFFLIASPIF